jgi:hypothetical protein
MADDIVAEAAEEFYNDLRDEPCILCGESQSYVLGSYTPEQQKHSKNEKFKAPVLYYTLCKQDSIYTLFSTLLKFSKIPFTLHSFIKS